MVRTDCLQAGWSLVKVLSCIFVGIVQPVKNKNLVLMIGDDTEQYT